MRTYRLLPNKFLRQYVERYWIGQSYDGVLPEILPGTGVELFFHFAMSPKFHNDSEIHNNVSQAHIVCLRDKAYRIGVESKLNFIAVRFRVGAFRHFCGLPMGELINSLESTSNIWGTQGDEFGWKVITSKSTQERITIIDSYLMKLFAIHSKKDKAMDFAIKEMYYNYKTIQLSQVMQWLNIGDRQFQRRFQQTMGIRPKYFQRIARFQSTMKYILLNKQQGYMATAFDNGYYDQSHFLKDFHHFVGRTPSDFLQENNFMSHFYNPR